MRIGMMRRAVLVTLFMTLPVLTAEPKLVNEGLIFQADFPVKVGPHTMRLSPNGRYLLYYRKGDVEPPGEAGEGLPQRSVLRLSVRDLETGDDQVLPIAAFQTFQPFLNPMQGTCFDPTGRRIVVGAGVDADGDGVFDEDSEKMHVVVYDCVSRKVTPLDITEDLVLPMFDQTGRSLVVMLAKRGQGVDEGLRIYTTPLETVNLKRLSVEGIPLAVCPTADLVTILVVRGPGERPAMPALVLFDKKADEKIGELTVRALLTACVRWTADGRFMYYYDRDLEDPGLLGLLTRVWDRLAGQEVEVLRNARPIGQGPTPTTVVLTQLVGRDRMVLHDAVANQTWTLGEYDRVVCAAAGHVVYAKKKEQQQYDVYLAEITMPDNNE